MRLGILNSVVLTVIMFFNLNLAYSFVEEKYKFTFKVKNKKANRNFIMLRLPDDVGNAELEFKNVSEPQLILDYISESKNALAGMKNQVNVKYIDEDNQTIIRFMREGSFENYNCVAEPDNTFIKGTCLRSAKLILPPDIEATILQNKTIIYTRDDVKEVLKTYLPYLAKLPGPNIPNDCLVMSR